jgi:membrane protein
MGTQSEQLEQKTHQVRARLTETFEELRAAMTAWLAASALFSWYVASFGSYNKTYGSLGAIIGFMTWIWLSIIVVLVGAQLNAELKRQTARESTTGGPKPLGMQGARAADTVGTAQK